MSTPATEHLLLIRGTDWDRSLTAEDIDGIMSRFTAWFDGLSQKGLIKSANPLYSEGKIVSGKKGQTVADGPFAESKEAIGGYFLLDVAEFAEALQIARECPILEFGPVVEVRPVAKQCALLEFAEARIAQVNAQARA
jgi:hypothetical protein